MFCHHFLMIFDLASLIVTHKYRYRDQGKLAALSIASSRVSSDKTFDADWTYADDANFIDKIWVWQLAIFIISFFVVNIGCFRCCNKSDEDMRDSQV